MNFYLLVRSSKFRVPRKDRYIRQYRRWDMKFLTVKELATKMKKTRKIISKEKAIITYNGKPIAIIRPLNEDNFENTVSEPTATYGIPFTDEELIRLKKAVAGMRREAKKQGITQKDIDDAIRAVRAENRRNKK